MATSLLEALTGFEGQETCQTKGCSAQTKKPGADGWIYLGWDGEFGIQNGYYCPAHGEAIESFHFAPETERAGSA
jgi:hypothetical protein